MIRYSTEDPADGSYHLTTYQVLEYMYRKLVEQEGESLNIGMGKTVGHWEISLQLYREIWKSIKEHDARLSLAGVQLNALRQASGFDRHLTENLLLKPDDSLFLGPFKLIVTEDPYNGDPISFRFTQAMEGG